jgi:hypothetical protein
VGESIYDQLGTVPRWWHCDKHGDAMPRNAWGCPECVVELRALAREQAGEIQYLRDVLNTAGGALWRLAPACIDDDEDRAKAEHARAVGLDAVQQALKRDPYVERAKFGA